MQQDANLVHLMELAFVIRVNAWQDSATIPPPRAVELVILCAPTVPRMELVNVTVRQLATVPCLPHTLTRVVVPAKLVLQTANLVLLLELENVILDSACPTMVFTQLVDSVFPAHQTVSLATLTAVALPPALNAWPTTRKQLEKHVTFVRATAMHVLWSMADHTAMLALAVLDMSSTQLMGLASNALSTVFNALTVLLHWLFLAHPVLHFLSTVHPMVFAIPALPTATNVLILVLQPSASTTSVLLDSSTKSLMERATPALQIVSAVIMIQTTISCAINVNSVTC